MNSAMLVYLVAFSLLFPLSIRAQDPTAAPATDGSKSALSFKVNDIDGNQVDLKKYDGDVVLMVNVASRCGNTPQYAGLESMYKKYNEKGFVVLGFPCNQFGGQEPGSEAEIKQFCQSRYNVSFDMFSKIDVNGDEQNPLYKYLTSLTTKPVGAGDISWNFEKFLVDRHGKVVARFAPRTKPEDDAVVKAVEAALAEPKPEKSGARRLKRPRHPARKPFST